MNELKAVDLHGQKVIIAMESHCLDKRQVIIDSIARMLYLADQRKLSNIYHFVLNII